MHMHISVSIPHMTQDGISLTEAPVTYARSGPTHALRSGKSSKIFSLIAFCQLYGSASHQGVCGRSWKIIEERQKFWAAHFFPWPSTIKARSCYYCGDRWIFAGPQQSLRTKSVMSVAFFTIQNLYQLLSVSGNPGAILGRSWGDPELMWHDYIMMCNW